MRWRRIKRKRKRIGAIKAARVARANGVPADVAAIVAYAAATQRVSPALAFALVEQESGFRHIFGHDPGGLFPGESVTRSRFRTLLAHVKAGGTSNGVGLTQITYGGYLVAHPGIWRKLANVKLGLALIGASVEGHGKREGLARYNGGPNPPAVSYGYADSVMRLEKKWRGRFASRKKGS